MAITLINYSCITDPRFNFRGSDIAEYWNKKMNSKFLMNSNLGYGQELPLKLMPQKLFSILKILSKSLALNKHRNKKGRLKTQNQVFRRPLFI